MGRAATTIVLITRQGIVRADFSGARKPMPIDVWQEARPETDDPAALVELALGLGPQPGRRVWVFSSDLWTQTMTLPTSKIVGLSPAKVADALNFEVETLSGQSAFESVTAHAPSMSSDGRESAFWVIQMRTIDRERIDDVIRKAGSRLAGIGHPAGLPRVLVATSAIEDAWQRIELWPDAVVCLHGDGQAAPVVHVLNIDPQQGRWQGAVEKLRSTLPATEHLELVAAAGIAVSGGYADRPLLSLDNPAALGKWLTSWAEYLADRPDGVPLVLPVARPLSAHQLKLIAGCLTLVVAGLCSAHYYLLMVPRIEQARAALEKAQQPAKALAEVEKQVKDLEGKQATLQKQDRKLSQDNEALARQRRRLPELLRFLAEHRAEDVVIQRIDSAHGDPRIHGVCLRPELADQFAHKLGQALASQGWAVDTTHKEALIVQGNGAPWAFEMQLKEINKDGPGSTPSAADQPAVMPRRR